MARPQNCDEDAIFVAAKSDFVRNRNYVSPAIQRLVDRIACVPSYIQHDLGRQGVIASYIQKERMRTNFLIDIEAYISEFWHGAFSSIHQAALTGAPWITKKNGQLEELPGTTTKMNPVNWLRRQGFLFARKQTDADYSKQLVQSCDDCFHLSAVTPMKEKAKRPCPAKGCGSFNQRPGPLSNIGPTARCLDCGTKFLRFMVRECGKCGSHNLTLQPRATAHADLSALPAEFITQDGVSLEERVASLQGTRHIQYILTRTYNSLPIDHQDPKGESQTRKLFKILTDTNDDITQDICRRCKAQDPKSCGADAFDIEECYNYSKKIGEYFGYTGALANSRMTKVRRYIVKVIREMVQGGDAQAQEYAQALHLDL